MADLIRTVGTGGYYATLADAVADLPASFVALGERRILKLKNQEFALAAALNFTAPVSDANSYLWITADDNAGFAANTSNPLRYGYGARLIWTAGNDDTYTWKGVLRLGNYARLSGLQIKHSVWGGSVDAVVSAGSYCRIEGNLIEREQLGAGALVVFVSDGNRLVNNWLVRSGGVDSGAMAVYCRTSTAAVAAANAVINNVFVRTADQSGGTAIDAGQAVGGALVSDNVVVGPWAVAAYAANSNLWAAGSGRLVSSLADGTGTGAAPGTGNTFSINSANLLTSIASGTTMDLRLKSGFTSYPGQRNQTYTNDLDGYGQSRSTTAPQIGAQENVPGVAPAPMNLGSLSTTASASASVSSSAWAAQSARPTADVSAGTWTASAGGSLFAAIDEVTADDADYISYTATGTCRVRFGALSDPGSDPNPVRVSYRIAGDGSAGQTVKLYSSTTLIATWTHTPAPATATTYTQTLTSGQRAAITNWSLLELEVTGT